MQLRMGRWSPCVALTPPPLWMDAGQADGIDGTKPPFLVKQSHLGSMLLYCLSPDQVRAQGKVGEQRFSMA